MHRSGDGGRIRGRLGGDGELTVVGTVAEHHVVQLVDALADSFRRQRHAFESESVFDVSQAGECHIADQHMRANAFLRPVEYRSYRERVLVDSKTAFDLPQAVILFADRRHVQVLIRLHAAQAVPSRRVLDGALVQLDAGLAFDLQELGGIASLRQKALGSLGLFQFAFQFLDAALAHLAIARGAFGRVPDHETAIVGELPVMNRRLLPIVREQGFGLRIR